MAIGLPEAVQVFEAFTGADGCAPVVTGGVTSVDVGQNPLWARVTFTGTPTVSYSASGGFTSNYYRVDALWVDANNRLEILINQYYVVCLQHTAGVVQRLGEFNLTFSGWTFPGSFDIQVCPSRNEVFVTSSGPYRAVVVGTIYGYGSWPSGGHFPAGSIVRVDTGSTTGTATVDAYLPVAAAGPTGWVVYPTDDANPWTPNPPSYLPWAIEGGHLRDVFSGDYDQTFGGSGYLVDGHSTFGRLDVDLYGFSGGRSAFGGSEPWFVIAAVPDSEPGWSWSGVTALAVFPWSYGLMVGPGFQPGGDISAPTFADGDTFSVVLTGYEDNTASRLRLFHNGTVYFDQEISINGQSHNDGTHVGMWGQNYGIGPNGYSYNHPWGVSNFRWTSLPALLHLPTIGLNANPDVGIAPMVVTLDASLSTPPPSPDVSYTFGFDDGSPTHVSHTDTSVVHTFTGTTYVTDGYPFLRPNVTVDNRVAVPLIVDPSGFTGGTTFGACTVVVYQPSDLTAGDPNSNVVFNPAKVV